MKTKKEYQERKLLNALKDNMDKAKAYLDDDEKMEKVLAVIIALVIGFVEAWS